MHILSRAPRKPKQADGQAKASHHCSIQPMLWSDNAASPFFVAFAVLLTKGEFIDDNDGYGAEDDAEADAEEGETGEAGGEVVDTLEDEGEGVEEGEEDGEIEAGVKAEEEDNGFCEDHVDWPCEGHCQ